MNHLAHLLLADGSPESIIGNFLGDFAKGRPEGRFPPAVVRGIRLHRRLDVFTDSHPAMLSAVEQLPRARRRYAGIAIDMALDHILARDWHARDATGFTAFRRHVYAVLQAQNHLLTPRARRIVPALAGDDWLLAYAQWRGINQALNGMSRRLSRPSPLAMMSDDLAAAWPAIEAGLHTFWPQVRVYAAVEQRRLTRHPGTA